MRGLLYSYSLFFIPYFSLFFIPHSLFFFTLYFSLFFICCLQAPDDFRKNLLFIVAYDPNNRVMGGTINLIKNTHFYGRYWGSFEYVKNLHFEACYYKAIEYCIENGISYMEPGAGNSDLKSVILSD